MVKCSVNLCPGKAKSKFPFPHNNHELCSQWIQTCCQDDPNWTPNPASKVCEVHFNEIDFEIVPYGKTFRKKLREGVIPSQNLPPGAPLVVTVMGDSADTIVNIPGHVQLETVVTDGTHYDTMDHVSHDDLNSITVDHSELQESLSLSTEDGHKIQIINVGPPSQSTSKVASMSKQKSLAAAKSSSVSVFDPSVIPDDVASNTMNIDHGYFLSFLPQQKTENESVSTSNEIKLSDSEMAEAIQAEAGIHEDDVAVAMMVTNDDDDDFPDVTQKIQSLSPDQKIEKLVQDLKLAYRKNRSLAKANKSLRLQLHQASKKTLSMKSKHEVAREVLAPFFTPTQIDCFCRPKWLRSRNWTEKDFEIALSLRKLMSKKAFGFLRKKRMIPMPSLTSLRKYQRINNIVIHHPTTKGSGQAAKKAAAAGKKTPAAKAKTQQQQQQQHSMKQLFGNNSVVVSGSASLPIVSAGSLATMMQNGNVVVTPLDGTSLLDGNLTFSNLGSNKIIQTIQIPVSSAAMLDDGGNQLQLQVVEALPNSKLNRVRQIDDNWKFIQISSSPDGTSTTYTIEQK